MNLTARGLEVLLQGCVYVNTSSWVSVAHASGPLESTEQNQTCHRGPLSDLESTRPQGGRGHLTGRSQAGPVGKVPQDHFLESPLCFGDAEPGPSPADSCNSQEFAVDESGTVHFLLNPHNIPLRKLLSTPAQMRKLRLEERGRGHTAGKGLSRIQTRCICLRSLSSQQLCSSWGDNVSVHPLHSLP